MSFELLETIFCGLALATCASAMVLIPSIRTQRNPGKQIVARRLWFAMLALYPWASILPISVFAYRIAQLRRAFPGTNPDYFWQTFQPHWLQEFSTKVAKDLNFLLGNLYPGLFLLFVVPVLIIGIAHIRGHLRWRDYGVVFLVHSVSWFLICCCSSFFWWND